jgi:hypothetical protein
MGSGGLSPWVKRPVREAHHLSTFSAVVKNEGAPLPICLHSIVLNQLSRLTNLLFFTFNIWLARASGMESPKECPRLPTLTPTVCYRFRDTVLNVYETTQNIDAEQRILFKLKEEHIADL